MPDTITFPGTKTAIPKWAVLAAGAAGLFIFLQSSGKKSEDPVDYTDPTQLLSAQLSDSLNDFLELVQDQIASINPPPVKPPPQIIGPPVQDPNADSYNDSKNKFLGPPIPYVPPTNLYNKATGTTTTLYLQNLTGLQGLDFVDNVENIDLPPVAPPLEM